MPITNPAQLVDEFKKRGEFDRLRSELFVQFQQSDGFAAFKSRTEDIARQRLTTDNKLRYMPTETVHRELMQELDRYPIVERAVADVRQFTDPTFVEQIRKKLQQTIDADSKPTKSQKHQKNEVNGTNSKSNNSKPRGGILRPPNAKTREPERTGGQGTSSPESPTRSTTTTKTERSQRTTGNSASSNTHSSRNDKNNSTTPSLTPLTTEGGSTVTENQNLDTPATPTTKTATSTTQPTGPRASSTSSNSSNLTELPSMETATTPASQVGAGGPVTTTRDGSGNSSLPERRRGSDVEMKYESLAKT